MFKPLVQAYLCTNIANTRSYQKYKTVLIVGAEKLSSILDFEDRTTCVLFGDGASATINAKQWFKYRYIAYGYGADGATPNYSPTCRWFRDTSFLESVNNRLHFLKMNGKEIFQKLSALWGNPVLSPWSL